MVVDETSGVNLLAHLHVCKVVAEPLSNTPNWVPLPVVAGLVPFSRTIKFAVCGGVDG